MADTRSRVLRGIAAVVVTLSGVALIGALWIRPLTELAVVDAVLGAAYLILGLGLFGQSRFSLLPGILLPGAAALYLLATAGVSGPGVVAGTRMAADATVALCCAMALWRQV